MVPEGVKPPQLVETIDNYVPESEHSTFDRDESLEGEGNQPTQEERRQAIVARAKQCIEEVEATGSHAYLRPHQIPGYLNGLRLIAGYDPDDEKANSGYLIAPTGSGKTATVLAIAQDTGARTLFVTNRHTLVDQALGESVPHFVPDAETRELSGRTRLERINTPTQPADIDFTNYLYITNGNEESTPKPGDYDLTILDEAHAGLGARTTEELKPHESAAMATIATTATPGTQAKSVIKRYPTKLDHKTMLDGIEGDYLSGIQIFAAHSGLRFNDITQNTAGEYTAKSLEPLIENPERNGMIYDMALHGLQHTDGSGLIVCIRGNGQQHAQDVAAGLSSKKHPLHSRKVYVEAIGDHRKDSHDAIQALKHGEIDYLTTTEMATQGVDFRALRIGIVATSIRSQLKLEQIMGRGMRLKDDPFLFYQLFDTPANHPEGLALAWDILGIKEPHQGMAVLRPGTSTDKLIPVSSLPPRLQPFPEKMRTDRTNGEGTGRSELVLAVDTTRADEPAEKRVSLTQLHNQTGIRHDILRRIMFDNAYTAGLGNNEDGVFEEQYPEEASILLDYLVSRKEDRTLQQSARELHIPQQNLANYVGRLGLHAAFLYPRNAQQRAPMQRYLGPAQHEQVREFLGLPRPMAMEEIGLQEIGQRADNFNFRSRDFLAQRGFIGEPITLTHGRQAYIYNRRTLEAYADSYKNAQPLPNKTDFVSVRTIADTHPDAREYHVFAAASILGAPVSFFKINSRHRDEFITEWDRKGIEKLLPSVIAYYDAQHNKRREHDASYDRHRTKNRVKAPGLNDILPENYERITEQELIDSLVVPVDKSIVRRIMKDLRIEREARGLRIADAQRVYTAIISNIEDSAARNHTEAGDITKPELRTRRPTATAAPRYIGELSSEPIDQPRALKNLKSSQYANTLLAIAKFHPSFNGQAKAARTETGVVVDRSTYTTLFALLQHDIRQIGEHWVPAPQICLDHGIEPTSLTTWIRQGNYNADHLVAVPTRNRTESLYFCSPELARVAVEALRSHTKRLPDSQSYNVFEESTDTTDA